MRRYLCFAVLACLLCGTAAAEQHPDMERLWRQAASGEIRFQKLVQPSKDSLSAMGDSAARFLAGKLSTADAREKWALIDIYRGIGKVATPYLIPALNTNNKDQLRTVCRCLADIKDTLALAAVLRVASHLDFTVRAEAVTAIGKIGGPTAVRMLDPYVADSVDIVRKAAVAGLGLIKEPSSAVLFLRALNDEYYGVRLVAYDGLVALDSLAHSVILTELPFTSGRTKALLVRLCGQLRIAGARGELERALSEPDNSIRGWAVWSLAHVIGEKSRSLLNWLARSEADTFVRSQAEAALGFLDEAVRK